MSPSRGATPEPPQRAPAGELISAAVALLLLLLMFAFKWYGVDGVPGHSTPYRTVNAWHSLTVLRWLLLATILAALATPVVHAISGWGRRPFDVVVALAGLATLTALLLAYRVLIALPSARATLDQKLGAYGGLLAVVAIAIGAHDALRAWWQEGTRTAAPPPTRTAAPPPTRPPGP